MAAQEIMRTTSAPSEDSSAAEAAFFREKRPEEWVRYRAILEAQKLKSALASSRNNEGLNIVTAESLTAGLISSTLVDVPGQGLTVYGGFVVYDTDAKRKMLGVTTKGVYSHKTAKQMALGALRNSRAMVALAVTGDAMPFPDDKERLGTVYVGCAIRGTRLDGRGIALDRQEPYVETKKLLSCDEFKSICDAWKFTRASNQPPADVGCRRCLFSLSLTGRPPLSTLLRDRHLL